MAVLQFFLLTLLLCVYSNSLTCKDEKNKSVDWYYLYKLPKEHNPNSLIQNGVAYMYITSTDLEIHWKLSNISINNTSSMPGLTLQPFYDNETSMHIFYNDETPLGSKTNSLGHTKGVLMSNNTAGFWLIHSVPKYPPTEEYYYPDTGVRFGQSFLCISLNKENINNVGNQLLYNEPFIYKSFIVDSLKKELENVNSVIEHVKVKFAPWYSLITLNSLNGEKFVSFAKSGKFGKEIYEDWVAPTLKSDLLVESWLNGAGRIPSDCNSIYQVKNVESVELPDKFSFSSSKDHSKWALSNSKNTNWICVGDINREEHQKLRGGGTVCISKEELWNEYKSSITATESCKDYMMVY